MNTIPESNVQHHETIKREPQPLTLPLVLPEKQLLSTEDEAEVITQNQLAVFNGKSRRVHEICEDEE